MDNIVSCYEWKLAGTATGGNSISLPTDFKELYINVLVGGNYNIEFNIIRNLLSSTKRPYRTGYYLGTNGANLYCAIGCSITSVNLIDAYDTSNDKSSTTTTSVYYR